MQFLSDRGRLLLLTFCSFHCANLVICNDAVRDKKHFSLFSVVTFKNEECTSESTFTGGVVKGTCYTATECSDKGGTTSGNCASGFGVCCTFISNKGTATINENRTYLQSLLYPTVETSTTAITYTINKMQSDICQIRLDFDNFVIAGPSVTDESGGSYAAAMSTCQDTMITTLTSGAFIPTLCGAMTGDHLYMDMGALSTDTAVIALTFATTTPTAATAMRSWRVKTSQIPCWAEYRAPPGCHRYNLDNMGQITSPNFHYGPGSITTHAAAGLNTGLELHGQDLTTCIRRSAGVCCVRYQVCTNFNGIDLSEAISLDRTIQLNLNEGLGSIISEGWSIHMDLSRTRGVAALTLSTSCINTDFESLAHCVDVSHNDSECIGDYVEIPDSTTDVKSYGAATQVNSRYCGARFGFAPFFTTTGAIAIMAATILIMPHHHPVYDCSEPFVVGYHSDIQTDDGALTAVSTYIANDRVASVGRGFCLDFRQEMC